ncbi:MAG: cytochrome P450 [Verrucomicrobiales bacterium]|nr:cytochrome P450 [Verrucomicrobiales bacterium]
MTYAPEKIVTDYETLRLDHLVPSRDHAQLAMLHQLQRDRPLHWHKGVWVLTRYADVFAALRDKRLVHRVHESDRKGLPFVRSIMKAIKRHREHDKKHWFHYADRPYHADVRRIMRDELTRQIPDLRQLFRSIADELLEKIDCNDEQSVRKGFVEPFPAMVAAELMGLPRERWRWFDECFGGRNDDGFSKGLRRIEPLLGQSLAKRGELPPGMIRALSDGCEADNLLSEEGLLPNSVLFALAAYVNTRPLLEQNCRYLLRNASDMERIQREPDVIRTAVEEFTRYFSTTAFCSRVATADVEIAGGVVHEGQWVKLALAAANHDPEVFDDPNHVDLARQPNPHVAFGGGMHTCVGAAVVRAELQESIMCLARRFR